MRGEEIIQLLLRVAKLAACGEAFGVRVPRV
jgi:hypothetical protein